MKPHELKPPAGARKARKRVGRGEGSGTGKTAGRGTKGTKARNRVRPFFEGGQMPLTRRVPKLKGFRPPHRRVFDPVNLADLAGIEADEIGPDDFRAAGLTSRRAPIKVLGSGTIDRAVTVRAHAFSKSAKSKIEAAGGRAEVVDTKESRTP